MNIARKREHIVRTLAAHEAARERKAYLLAQIKAHLETWPPASTA